MSVEVISKIGINLRPPRRILKILLFKNMLHFLTEKKVSYLIFIFWNILFTTMDAIELPWNDM